MIHVGFTGTQRGMTDAQRHYIRAYLAHKEYVAHHGDCVGADADFDCIARPRAMWMHLHPCTISAKRAWCEKRAWDICEEPIAPLLRNRAIVAACTLLIAATEQDHPVQRSGTWSTIRLTSEYQRRVVVVYPDGGSFDCLDGWSL